jgi:hypothetical protein
MRNSVLHQVIFTTSLYCGQLEKGIKKSATYLMYNMTKLRICILDDENKLKPRQTVTICALLHYFSAQ